LDESFNKFVEEWFVSLEKEEVKLMTCVLGIKLEFLFLDRSFTTQEDCQSVLKILLHINLMLKRKQCPNQTIYKLLS